MKTNIQDEFHKEVEQIIEKFKSCGWDQLDTEALKRKVKIDGEKRDLIIVLYPKLLYFDKNITPWVCIRMEEDRIKEDEELTRDMCEFMLAELEKCGLKPFKDEDAFHGYFTKEDHKLMCYVNLDYPDGYWENHTL